MTTKRIEFQMVTPGGPHTACVEATVSDNGDFESIVSVPRLNIRRIEDLDALIAALREARDEIEPRDRARVAETATGYMVAHPVLPPQTDEEKQAFMDDALKVIKADQAERIANPPAAPEPNADAPRVRLTRAQREALEMVDRDKDRTIYNMPQLLYRRARALTLIGLVMEDGYGFQLTDAGRAALRDAGARDDIEQLRQNVRDAQAVVDDLMAQPNPLDAAPEPQRDAPPVRLTRRGREILEVLDAGGTIVADARRIRLHPNDANTDYTFMNIKTFRSVESYLSCEHPNPYVRRYHINDAGRAALAAAQRGDAIRAPRDGA